MTENACISIIVPIYNTAEYLEKCVTSIQEQSYQNIEIILVDDGSTDQSLEISRKLAEKDTRIIVLHKENGGANSARKAALSVATGEYVGFVDSDDWIDTDMYRGLMHIMQTSQADIVSSGFVGEYEGSRNVTYHDSLEEGMYEGEKLSVYLYGHMLYNGNFSSQGIFPGICFKLFKMGIIKKVYENIDKRIFFGEDAAIFYPACLEAEQIVITYQKFYHYRMRNDSVCHEPDTRLLMNTFYLYQYLKSIFNKYANKDILLRQLDMYLIYLEYFNMKMIYGIDLFEYGEYTLPIKYFHNKRIVIYGAGEVGRSFYRQLKEIEDVEVVLWVDSGYSQINGDEMVTSPQKISEQEYDYIIIAVQNKHVATEIRNQLLETAVEEHKIIWLETQRIYPFEDV